MPLNPKWRHASQWLFIIISFSLGVLYVSQPERQPFPQVLLKWYQIALSGSSSVIYDTLLPPRPLLQTDQQPLLEYNTLLFLGCDLAMQAGQLQLVTYWAGDITTTNYALHFRFHSPYGHYLVSHIQAVTLPMFTAPLPLEFYETSRAGQIWLQVVEQMSGSVIQPTFALNPTQESGWQRICS